MDAATKLLPLPVCGEYPIAKNGIFRRLLFLFAVLFMLFAQIEGSFDDIPQFVNTIEKNLIASSQPTLSGCKTSACRASFDNAKIVETDDEDACYPALHSSTIYYAFLRSGENPELSISRAVSLIETGTSKDKSPPVKLT
jgi:hypothetical protein